MDDATLLHEFVQRRSQSAFRQLVERHTNLVYACALQRLHDAHAAQDVTQAVFLTLALKAKDLRPDRPLAGWLFVTTGYVAARYHRGEQRRKEREMRAVEHQIGPDHQTAPAWSEIELHLSHALESLSADDRTAVLLRFYENASHREIGSALRLSEEAAKKRVNRALEKLRRFFAGKGVMLTVTGLAGALTAHVTSAAPTGLAATVSASIVGGAGGTLVTTETLMLAKGALKAMFIAKVQTVSLITAACLITAGAGITVAQQAAQNRSAQSKGTVIAIEPNGLARATTAQPGSQSVLPSPAAGMAVAGADLSTAPVVAASANRTQERVKLLKANIETFELDVWPSLRKVEKPFYHLLLKVQPIVGNDRANLFYQQV